MLQPSGNKLRSKGDAIMKKLRKFAFIKVALFCLLFLLVYLSSVYALAETKQNERFVLKDIPFQSFDKSSSIIFMKSQDPSFNYLLTTFNAAGKRISFDIDNTGTDLIGSPQAVAKYKVFNNRRKYQAKFEAMIGRNFFLYLNELEESKDITIQCNFHIMNGKSANIIPIVWTENSRHIIMGKMSIEGYLIESDSEYPLVFKIVKDKGYTYLCGRGTITDKDGKTYKLGYNDTVDKWLPLLKSDDQLDREGATQALGWLAKTKEDKDKAVPALISALSDNAMEVRRDSAESLGRIGDLRAKETLEKIAKDDKDDWVREVAEESLGLIGVKEATARLNNGDKTAINDLAKALEHKWFLVRRTAVESLEKAGKEAVDPLITALKNDDSEVRIKSAEALIRIGDKKVLEPLNKALAEEKDEDVKKAFEEAIEKLEK